MEGDSKFGLCEGAVCDQGVLFVSKFSLPGVVEPGEVAVHPYADSAVVSSYVVFLSHVWVVEVSEAQVFIEVDEHLAVAEYQRTRHR